MDHVDKLISKAEKIVANPAKFWSKAAEDVRAAAILMMMSRGIITRRYIEIAGSKKDAGMPDWTLGLAILVRIEPWLDLSASEAEGTALKIISILKKTSSGVPKLSSADVIATVVIRDKYEAHRVTRLLLDLSQRAKIKTSYELGLIRALESWMASTAYRVISPNDLKALRGELEYTQEAMAGALKVTLRHYSRYEAGMAGVPKKKRTAINRLRRRASKGHSTTAASPKMRAQRPALKLKS